jgi:hypothetical protein
LKAEERLKDLEKTKGNYTISIAENVYSLWRNSHYSINYFADKYGFNIEFDEFLLDFIELKIQQETGVEMPPKREKKNIHYDFDRHLELQRKSSQRVYRDVSEISFSFFWAIKHNTELDQPPEIIVEDEDSNLKKTDGLYTLTRFRKGQQVRRINMNQTDYEKFKNTVYTVHEYSEHYVTVVNQFGKIRQFLSHNLELVNAKK